ncbi:unnamed protein product [Callosobruchus maculatus]|uniref:Uncharacterized protein n=1 Tax=Callosobruchus maculatus TaxID=64391 RepID=A0A653CSG9_CALMS|nr:unnamed protein product [Callosobruchus maculatus]
MVVHNYRTSSELCRPPTKLWLQLLGCSRSLRYNMQRKLRKDLAPSDCRLFSKPKEGRRGQEWTMGIHPRPHLQCAKS